MKQLLFLFATLCLLAGCGPDQPAPVNAGHTGGELVPRADLFDAQERIRMRVSPDGTRLAWMQGQDGRYQIFGAPRDHLEKARALTEPSLEVTLFNFAPNGTHLIINANKVIYSYALGTGTLQRFALPGMEDLYHAHIATSFDHPDDAIIAAYNRSWGIEALARVNIVTGAVSPIELPEEDFRSYIFDRALNLRAAMRWTDANDIELWSRSTAGWTQIDTIPQAFAGSFKALQFDGAGERLYTIDARDLGMPSLMQVDLESGARELVAGVSNAPVVNVLFDPLTADVDAFLIGGERNEWAALTPNALRAFASITGPRGGTISILSRSLDDRYWISYTQSRSHPGHYQLIDTETGVARDLLDLWPALSGRVLSDYRQIDVTLANGDTQRAIIHFDAGLVRDERGLPTVARPTMVGMEATDWFLNRDEFDPILGWLTNRGFNYVQLEIPVREDSDPQALVSRLEAVRLWLEENGIANETIIIGDGVRVRLALDVVGRQATGYDGAVLISPDFVTSSSMPFNAPDDIEGPLLIGIDDFTEPTDQQLVLDLLQTQNRPDDFLAVRNEVEANSIVNNKRFLALSEAFLHHHFGTAFEPVTTARDDRDEITVLYGNTAKFESSVDLDE